MGKEKPRDEAKRERRAAKVTGHRQTNSAIVAEEKDLTKRVLKKRADKELC